jgi:hypothetical protein
MKTKIQRYILAFAILVALIGYFIRFNGLESTRSGGGLFTSVVCDALTDKPAHVKWVVLSDLGSMHSGGNSRFLLIGEQKCVVPSKVYALWLAHSGESPDPNLFYLNRELEFSNLGVNIDLSQLNEIHALMKHSEALGLTARGIVELVTKQKLNIPKRNES